MKKSLSPKICMLLIIFVFAFGAVPVSGQRGLEIICPPHVTVPCGFLRPPPNFIGGNVISNCPPPSAIMVGGDQISELTCPNRFTITREYSVSDNCNPPVSCFQIITVFDNIPPTIICPGPVLVKCRENVPAPDITIVTATDNCGGVPVISHVEDEIIPGECINRYRINRRYKAVDACNNEAFCTQMITVYDNITPQIVCPPVVTVACLDALPAKDFAGGAVSDNCEQLPVVEWVRDVVGPGNCLKIVTRTYRATDACGNQAECTQLITVLDNIPPTFTNCPQNITVSCKRSVPEPDIESVTATDNCGEVTVTWTSDVLSDVVCENKYKITRTYTARDACGNERTCVQVITVKDELGPFRDCPEDIVVKCPGDVPPRDFAGGEAEDNCGGPVEVVWESDFIYEQVCLNRYGILRTYRATDVCGNIRRCHQTITVRDDVPPTFTAAPSITIDFLPTCELKVEEPTAIDNCPGDISFTWTDEEPIQCGNDLVILRHWRAEDQCGNARSFDQTITVIDNNTDYLVYATDEVKFGEGNEIKGDVGVTSASGKADFKKNSILDPFKVYAKTITVHPTATVSSKFFTQATGGPAPPHSSYSGGGLSGTHHQIVNGMVPAGDFKNLTIKKGITAIVPGSNYGKITIEENADVTFTSECIQVEDFIVKKGKSPGTTKVHFDTYTGIRVKDKVDIEENSRINVSGPKLIFYMGANKEFSVRANYTEVTANVHGGKLKVSGHGNGGALMTGWYIVEKLESDSKNVIWSPYDCTPLARNTVSQKTSPVPPVLEDGFSVSVYPNPSGSEFNIRIAGKDEELVQLRIYDLAGKTVFTKANISTSMIQVGSQLQPGIYFAELRQGSAKQTVKLIKMK